MKRFLLGVLTGVVLMGITGLILVLAAARLGDRKPVVKDGSTLVLKLQGTVDEVGGPDVSLSLSGVKTDSTPTILEIHQLLRHAASDKRIKAVLFEPLQPGVGWAKMQEIREALLAFKRSGKPVHALLRSPRGADYFMASVADRIYLTPSDVLDLKGIRFEPLFLKGALEKVGAEFEVEHAGKYKDAGDILTRKDLSPESREVLNAMLDGLYGTLVNSLAKDRKRSPDEMRAIIDRGPFTARQAKANGLVDELWHQDQINGALAKQAGQQDLIKVSAKDYLKAMPAATGKQIAVLAGQGEITRGTKGMGDTDGIASDSFIAEVRRVANDKDVQGVVLRIDSPGGDAAASEEMMRELRLLSRKKPLVVSMSDYAASGGYYMAATGDPIVAYPNTITGSIGVIYGRLLLRGTYDKLGVTKEVLTRGQNAAIDSDIRPADAAGRAKLQEIMGELYGSFLKDVAEARKRPVSEIQPVAEGRAWLGLHAKDKGLVDELGGLDKAIELVRKRAKIGPNETIQLVAFPARRSFLELLLNSSSQPAGVGSFLRPFMPGMNPDLWLRGGVMARSPWLFEVR